MRSFLTSERSAERWIFGSVGAGLSICAVRQGLRAQFGVAAFLAIVGLALLLAVALCSDKALRAIGTVAILVNIFAAVATLFGS